jgi:hypothetical protein
MAIKIATKVANIEEVAAQIVAQQQADLESSLPNKVVVRVESASGNIMDGKNALGQGLIYGRVVRILKGDSVVFESADGETHERPLKGLINGQFSMSVGVQEARSFAQQFQQIRPEERGGRRCEVEFAFDETIFVNTNATIVAEGVVIGDLKAPQGQAIGSADEFDKMFAKKTQESIEYRATRRQLLQAERMQQLEALNTPTEEKAPETSDEVVLNLNNI